MDNLEKLLLEDSVGKVIKNEPLKNHTTMKVGGPADLFVEPDSIDNLKKTIKHIRERNVKWRAIGRGSNLLIPDEGVRGVVIKLGSGLDHLEINDEEILVGAGYSIIKLATIISKEGLSGLEFAGGIPGSVGGAVFMNAGAHGSDISKILKKAHILFPDGTLQWLSQEEMEFAYRTSVLQQKRPGVCVEAIFQLEKGEKDKIVTQMQKHKDYRRDTQPWNYPCSGSVFRNPLPKHSGQLIEEAGLKGFSIGGAKVSEKHANFIVNAGDAKAQDVLDLIEHIQRVIFEKYNVELEPEIETIG